MLTDLVAKKTPGGLLARVLGKKRPKPGEQAQIPPATPATPSDADLWAKAAKDQDPQKKINDLNATLAAQLSMNDPSYWPQIMAGIQPQIQKLQFGIANPPTRMPTKSDQEAGKRKSIAEQRRRRGRASTILTEDPLGA